MTLTPSIPPASTGPAKSGFDWDFSAPRSPALGDHDVPVLSDHLRGRRIALLVTGGIAGFKAPSVARAFRRHGAEVAAGRVGGCQRAQPE